MGEPSNVGELRSFLSMVYQLEQVIPQLAKKFLSKKNCWVSGAEQARAFPNLKDVLTSPPVLAMYDPNREVSADSYSYCLVGGGFFPEVGRSVEACSLCATVFLTDSAEKGGLKTDLGL